MKMMPKPAYALTTVLSFLLGTSLYHVSAFVPKATTTRPSIRYHGVDIARLPRPMMLAFDPTDLVSAASTVSDSTTIWMDGATSTLFSSSNFLSFSDQGQNLAGIFFQASLFPYLIFLYFLSFRANRISDLGNYGFQFVLLFVLSTIPSGIISRSVYGFSLADTDWLHGGAETLLTLANVLIVSARVQCKCCNC